MIAAIAARAKVDGRQAFRCCLDLQSQHVFEPRFDAVADIRWLICTACADREAEVDAVDDPKMCTRCRGLRAARRRDEAREALQGDLI